MQRLVVSCAHSTGPNSYVLPWVGMHDSIHVQDTQKNMCNPSPTLQELIVGDDNEGVHRTSERLNGLSCLQGTPLMW